MYISYDDGASWQSLRLNMADVPISDVIVEGNELVVATHGRGFWVLDNIAPLRQVGPEVLAKSAHLFNPPAGVRSGPGVMISWMLKSQPTSLRLEILDSAGSVLRTFSADTTRADSTRTQGGGGGGGRFGGGVFLPRAAGLQRVSWDLRADGITSFPGMILWGAGTNGPAVPPGRYTVRLTADGQAVTAPLTVRRNPRIVDVTDADLRAQYAFSKRVRDKAEEANQAVIAIRRVKAQLADRTKRSDDATLKTAGEKLTTTSSAVEESIYQVRNQSGQDPLNFPIRVNNRLANLLSMAERGDGPPNNNMGEIFGILSAELKTYTDRLAQVWATDLVAVNRELGRLNLPPLDPKCARAEGCGAP
jgi:hypothetical protein